MSRYYFFNGLGFPFLSVSVVVLLATQFEASNQVLGIIAAVGVAAGCFQIFVSWLLGGKDIIRMASNLWLLRGLAFAAVFATPTLAFWFGNSWALTVIVLVSLVFCVAKSFATVTFSSIFHALSFQDRWGEITAEVQTFNNFNAIFSSLAAFVILHYGVWGGIKDLFLVVGIGIVLNSSAALALRQVPYHQTITRRGILAVFHEFRRLQRMPGLRQSLKIAGLNAGQIVLIAFAINYLKKVLHYPDEKIMIYQIGIFVGYVFGNEIGRRFLDRLGTRRMLVLTNMALFILACGWAMLPPKPPLVLILSLGTAVNAIVMLTMLIQTRLILQQSPAGDKIAYQGVFSLMSAVIGFVVGYGGGLLCDLMEPQAALLGWMHPYSLVFGLLAISALIGLSLSQQKLKMEPLVTGSGGTGGV